MYLCICIYLWWEEERLNTVPGSMTTKYGILYTRSIKWKNVLVCYYSYHTKYCTDEFLDVTFHYTEMVSIHHAMLDQLL